MSNKLEEGLLIIIASILTGMWVFFLILWGKSCGGQIVGVIKSVGDIRALLALFLSLTTDIMVIGYIFEMREAI